MKPLPIGMSDFKKIVQGGYIYVDKTRYVYEMVSRGQYFFVSRPRRFGKSLTVSLLEYLFKGEKELFKDTWIHDRWDWKEYPVVRLDLNNLNTETPRSLKDSLTDELIDIADSYGVELKKRTYDGKFSELIEKISDSTGKPVVLLIDEYEKPILDHVQNKEEAHQMREVLRQVYTKIKSLDRYLRFVFITGITKYTKVGVFSTLNNLNEISFDEPYAQMFGYTREEIEEYFQDHIEQACKSLNMDREVLFDQLEKYYGGYSFDGKHSVFNPFAVLLFFDKKKFLPYWHETGAPKFLFEYLKSRRVGLKEILEERTMSRAELLSQEIEEAKAKSFLVQAGYLTFKRELSGGTEYEIGFPNLDAGQAVAQMILEIEYGLKEDELRKKGNILREAVMNGKVELMMKTIEELFASMSYATYEGVTRGIQKEEDKLAKLEAHYAQLLYALLFGTGINCELEKEVAGGRIDLWFSSNGIGYIVELKVDKSPQEALKQIKTRGYAQMCKLKKCYMIGLSVSSGEKGHIEWVYEEVN